MRKKIGRNPKSDRDWKDRKKIEISKDVQIEKGNISPNRIWKVNEWIKKIK